MDQVFLLLIVATILVAGAYFIFNYSLAPSIPRLTVPQESETGSSGQVSQESSGEQVVELTSQGFSPVTLTIPVGTKVRFVNKGSVPFWPASGIHPSHLVCPGFDAKRGLQLGESYSFTFTVAKACPMHDHLNPAVTGAIIVE